MFTLYFISLLLVNDLSVSNYIGHFCLDLFEETFFIDLADHFSKYHLVCFVLNLHLFVHFLQSFVVSTS